MIRTFCCKHTKRLFSGESCRQFRGFERIAQRKLKQLDAAVALGDLSIVPGNHLEALKGGRKGQHSIRINDQWRICFVWNQGHAHDVQLVDYH